MQNELEKQKEQLYKYLTQKYKRTVINKVEMAFELGISNSTLDLYIAKKIGLPNYKKLGDSKNSKVIFNLLDVADFLTQTIKTN
ncbi:MAG: hypothetical protein PHH92_10600 [Aliarcobacter skirrowii]|uniref:hypothetical protein n=1 Tax=Aliarcobacter skirrowii TaxID=28200 RepID=UPI002432F276|nr:hypothetical protein [Aliarcobacter skirrowii]MDD3497820.1 hypothetical protein [Aliarcobacter skirrowii]